MLLLLKVYLLYLNYSCYPLCNIQIFITCFVFCCFVSMYGCPHTNFRILSLKFCEINSSFRNRLVKGPGYCLNNGELCCVWAGSKAGQVKCVVYIHRGNTLRILVISEGHHVDYFSSLESWEYFLCKGKRVSVIGLYRSM